MTGRFLTLAVAMTLSASMAYADQARQRWPGSSQGSSGGQGSSGQGSGGQSSGGQGSSAPAPPPAPRSASPRSASPRAEAPPPPQPQSGGGSQIQRWGSTRTEPAPPPAPRSGGSQIERWGSRREEPSSEPRGGGSQIQRWGTPRVVTAPTPQVSESPAPSEPSAGPSAIAGARTPAPQSGQRRAEPRRYPTVEEQQAYSPRAAVPRGTVRPAPNPGTSGGAVVYGRPTTRIYNNYYYYPRNYYPYGYGSYGLGYFYYDPYTWYDTYPYYPDYYPSYGGVYQYRYGYPTGEIRLQVRPRHAEVYVDGYYAGRVDDFDGFIQALRIEEGPHTIEIVAPGYQPLVFNVRIIAGRKIEYRGELYRY